MSLKIEKNLKAYVNPSISLASNMLLQQILVAFFTALNYLAILGMAKNVKNSRRVLYIIKIKNKKP